MNIAVAKNEAEQEVTKKLTLLDDWAIAVSLYCAGDFLEGTFFFVVFHEGENLSEVLKHHPAFLGNTVKSFDDVNETEAELKGPVLFILYDKYSNVLICIIIT